MTGAVEEIPSFRILDTRVNKVRMTDVMELMARWIEEEPSRLHHIVNTGMHGIMEAHKDPEFGAILNSADLLAPDGILAILVARLHGYRLTWTTAHPKIKFFEVDLPKGITQLIFSYSVYDGPSLVGDSFSLFNKHAVDLAELCCHDAVFSVS